MYPIKTSYLRFVKILAIKFFLCSALLHPSHKGQFLITQQVVLSILYLGFSTLVSIVRHMIFSPVFYSNLHLWRELYFPVAGVIMLRLL